jgi:hypothetical protein
VLDKSDQSNYKASLGTSILSKKKKKKKTSAYHEIKAKLLRIEKSPQ